MWNLYACGICTREKASTSEASGCAEGFLLLSHRGAGHGQTSLSSSQSVGHEANPNSNPRTKSNSPLSVRHEPSPNPGPIPNPNLVELLAQREADGRDFQGDGHWHKRRFQDGILVLAEIRRLCWRKQRRLLPFRSPADEEAVVWLRAVVDPLGVLLCGALGNDLIHSAHAAVIAAHACVADIIALSVLIEECEAHGTICAPQIAFLFA